MASIRELMQAKRAAFDQLPPTEQEQVVEQWKSDRETEAKADRRRAGEG